MLAKRSGVIINISTTAAAMGVPDISSCSATNAALDALTRTYAAGFGSDGVSSFVTGAVVAVDGGGTAV